MSASFMLILAVLNSEFDVNLKIIMIYKNNTVVVNDMEDHIFLPKTQAFKCKIQVHIILLILVTLHYASYILIINSKLAFHRMDISFGAKM